METTLSPDKTASAIWSRAVKPERGDFTPEAARAILKLDFDPVLAINDPHIVEIREAFIEEGRFPPR